MRSLGFDNSRKSYDYFGVETNTVLRKLINSRQCMEW
jgi:hypothetical protein